MNLVLEIEGIVVEVDNGFDFAITKTYEELQNPTIINNEWSKTLSIPMTVSNNRLFGDIFDVERSIIANDGTHSNIGIYFNPTKKANFTLYYNSAILTTGYVKLGAIDNTKHVYEINLFGELGNTFLELLKCGFNYNNTEDKYIIATPYIVDTILTKELVKQSWDNDTPKLDMDEEGISITDYIGFAPTICGLPNGFAADTILDGINGFKKIADKINALKNIDYGDAVIGDGLTERQMGEFRIYNQKPYIYVNKLWQMFVKKSKQICKFPLRLDKAWFNANNPYYTDLIYWCNDIETQKDKVLQYPEYEPVISIPYNSVMIDKIACSKSANKLELHFYTNVPISKTPLTTDTIDISKDVCLNVIVAKDGNIIADKVIISRYNDAYNAGYNQSNRILPKAWYGKDNYWAYDVDVPMQNVNEGDVITITYEWKLGKESIYRYMYVYANDNKLFFGENETIVKQDNGYSVVEGYRCSLDFFWNPDVSPFEVLLNYSKMFGLIFQVNQKDRCIDVTARNVYFNDYKIVDWTDKINTLNKFKIEQPTFEKKYINFNYDDVDADNYKDYYNKHQIALGGKRLITGYDFNNEEENLYNGIQPTNVLNQKITTMIQLNEWIVGQAIPKVDNPEIYFDNQKGNESANIYSAFAFRRKNQPVAIGTHVKITEDTPVEVNADTYCYHDSYYNDYMIESNILPFISTINDSGKYGCTFNLPVEINFNSDVMPYDNAKFIFDNFWKDYIDERYCEQNKKVTLEVCLTPLDFTNFQFNHFVKINNTLYIVNQIKDYGVENGVNTEVELISICNITGYTAGEVFHYAYFDTKYMEVEYTGGTSTVDISITADINWRVSCPTRGAMTFNQSSGTGNGVITATIQALRTGVESRYLTVNLYDTNNNVVDVLRILQYREETPEPTPSSISITPSSYYIEDTMNDIYDTKNVSVQLQADVNWEVEYPIFDKEDMEFVPSTGTSGNTQLTLNTRRRWSELPDVTESKLWYFYFRNSITKERLGTFTLQCVFNPDK